MENSVQIPTERSVASKQLTYQELDILHALRGFCAFYVVVYHAKYILWSGGSAYLQAFPRAGWGLGTYFGFAADMLSSAGYEMVIFFFVLSGFFIRYAQSKKHRTTLNFYLNRITRIYPPYLFSLLLAVSVLAGLALYRPDLLTYRLGRELNSGLLDAWHEFQQQSQWKIARTLAFLKVQDKYLAYNLVYWSLLPEAIFYLAVPFVFRRAQWYYIGSTILFVANLILPKLAGFGTLATFLFVYNWYFALGSCLYDVIVSRQRVLQTFRQVNGPLLFGLLLLLFVAIIGLSINKLPVLSTFLSAVLAVLCVLTLVAGRVNARNFFIRVFHKIGLFSFSLYLYHVPLLLISYALLTTFTGVLFTYSRWYWVIVPVVSCVCYGLYYCTERVAVQYFRKI